MLPKYQENLSDSAQQWMGVVYRCVHCTCGGKLCLNRNIRLINFAYDTEHEARSRGAFMLANVARSLFNVVRQSREWGAEHVAVIDAHFHTLRDLAVSEDAVPVEERPIGKALEDCVDNVSAWVEWLDLVGKRLVCEHKTTFPCFRRASWQGDRITGLSTSPSHD